MGVSLDEARHWHRRAYGPQNEIAYLAPEELGHAAAYEAYRSWIYNKHLYEPLSGDIERQREALTGLAVAEATRVLQYSTHSMDQYARIAATEAAAHTANYIFYQSREHDYRSRSRFRSGIDDPYARDDELLYPGSAYGGHARSRSRHARSLSRHHSHSFSQPGGLVIPPYAGHGYPSSSMSALPQVGYPGVPGQLYGGGGGGYGASQVPVPMYGAPMSAGLSAGSAYGGMGISPTYNTGMVPGVAASYGGGGSAYGGGSNYGGSSYGGSAMGAMYPRTRSNSFTAYPAQSGPYNPQPTPYMGSAMSIGSTMSMPVGMPAQGGQTIIIKGRKHKHKRSHSSDRDFDDSRSHHSSRY
ncbi:hypothetical protein HYPSUDRAFT_62780 [Hypholoma sublateritium FD-334 SS-4]|uniref:Uncharacterized protein n=1 Tax=Hypholoma sublateritium (strain FD-334 SS-4) TaxID=945553 RepID=A0A0D2MUU0_HYPSF|nr:hypothetical protein HYPSUDRAFT_62780 [Hypholoma sublateritium FD-334 SS-4]